MPLAALKNVWNYPILGYVLPLGLGLLFCFLSVTADREISPTRLTILAAEIIIWTIASVAAFRFKRYALSITDHEDGKALNYVANALLLLTLYVVLFPVASTIVGYFAGGPYMRLAVGLRNHLPILIVLASSVYLLRGSINLVKITGQLIWSRRRLMIAVLSALTFFILFALVFYQSQPHKESADGIPQFVLPIEALVLTYILPHVALWFIGVMACLNIARYASSAPGIIYRSLFNDLYRGILVTFIAIFMAQFLLITSTGGPRRALSLTIVYAILLIAVAGFLLILRGAQQLDKLEKVTGKQESR